MSTESKATRACPVLQPARGRTSIGGPTCPASTTSTGQPPPVALVALLGPLAGAASADRPIDGGSTVTVVPGSLTDVSVTTSEGVLTIAFTESSVDTGGVYPGTSATTWTCVIREGRESFR